MTDMRVTIEGPFDVVFASKIWDSASEEAQRTVANHILLKFSDQAVRNPEVADALVRHILQRAEPAKVALLFDGVLEHVSAPGFWKGVASAASDACSLDVCRHLIEKMNDGSLETQQEEIVSEIFRRKAEEAFSEMANELEAEFKAKVPRDHLKSIMQETLDERFSDWLEAFAQRQEKSWGEDGERAAAAATGKNHKPVRPMRMKRGPSRIVNVDPEDDSVPDDRES